MLNCTVTCRGADKKPCDNILNLEPAGKLIGIRIFAFQCSVLLQAAVSLVIKFFLYSLKAVKP